MAYVKPYNIYFEKVIFIRSEGSWHRQQTNLDTFIKLQLLGSANTFTVNTQNVRGMLIDRPAQECSVGREAMFVCFVPICADF